MSKKVVILSDDDFEAIRANLHDARLETMRIQPSHSQDYVRMKIERALTTLMKEGDE